MKKLNDFLPDGSAPEHLKVSLGLEGAGDFKQVTEAGIRTLLKPRVPFSHKGTYGHALIIAGAPQTMGAALLSATACLHAGAGLTSACIPESGLTALNTLLPEVMYLPRGDFDAAAESEKYAAFAIGPGLGQDAHAKILVGSLLSVKKPAVFDADALNILAGDGFLLQNVVPGSIFTPHMKEFDNLFGHHEAWFERLQTGMKKATEMGIIIVLKNQYTFIIDPAAGVFINPTGNPGMAQGGMGDVLTGVIAAHLAQSYKASDAAIVSCFIHGKAGDDLSAESFNMSASQVAVQVPKSRYQLQSSELR